MFLLKPGLIICMSCPLVLICCKPKANYAAITKKTALRRVLQEISGDFDFIIIDSPPALGFLSICALTASDYLLLPVQQQIFSFEGLSQLLVVVRNIQKTMNSNLKIAGILFTMCEADFKDIQKLSDSSLFKKKVFPTTIPKDRFLMKASDRAMPAVLLDVTSKGAMAYMNLARELMDRLPVKATAA